MSSRAVVPSRKGAPMTHHCGSSPPARRGCPMQSCASPTPRAAALRCNGSRWASMVACLQLRCLDAMPRAAADSVHRATSLALNFLSQPPYLHHCPEVPSPSATSPPLLPSLAYLARHPPSKSSTVSLCACPDRSAPRSSFLPHSSSPHRSAEPSPHSTLQSSEQVHDAARATGSHRRRNRCDRFIAPVVVVAADPPLHLRASAAL